MAHTRRIIDLCLIGIGEQDLSSPYMMSREDVLWYINELYQGRIAEAIENMTHETLSFAEGIATLPADFLKPEWIYDGDAPDQEPLEQIFDIHKKVSDDARCQQFMIPDNNKTMWIFGKTPTRSIKVYYIPKPDALTDSATSIPVALDEQFHRDIFVARIKEVLAENQNNTYDMMDWRAKIEDLLSLIHSYYKKNKRDRAVRKVRVPRFT